MKAEAAPEAWSPRLLVVCFAAVSISLPIAFMSLAKILLFVFTLVYVLLDARRKQAVIAPNAALWPRLLLLAVVWMALSVLWTDADIRNALEALVKHAKLLVILLIVSLVRSAGDARRVMTAFAWGSLFLLVSSWLLALGVAIPWTTDPFGKNVVFSSYLDQSIMFATSAAVFWHLRGEGWWPRWLSIAFALGAITNTLLLLDGRTGYLIAIGMVALALAWEMPHQWRLPVLVGAPLLLVAGLYVGAPQWKARMELSVTEGRNYSQTLEAAKVSGEALKESSMGWRANAWKRSLEAIAESPVKGHGAGSWTVTAKRMQGAKAVEVFGTGNSNPHQQFLLWGVELGAGGALLLLATLASMAVAAWRFAPAHARASLSVVLALTGACMLNSTLYDDLIGDYFCILLGCVLAAGMQNSGGAANINARPAA